MGDFVGPEGVVHSKCRGFLLLLLLLCFSISCQPNRYHPPPPLRESEESELESQKQTELSHHTPSGLEEGKAEEEAG